MEHPDKKLRQQVLQWLDIVKDDLVASKILYLSNLHRNSYYFFQQAVEKANKALALYAGFTEEELKRDIGHSQLKIFQEQIKDQVTGVQQLVDTLEKFPFLNEQTVFKRFDFKKHHKTLLDSLLFFQQVNNLDLVHIPLGEIDALLNVIDEAELADFEVPDYTDPLYKQILFEVSGLMGKIDIQAGETTKAEFDALINDGSGQAAFIKLLRYQQRIIKLVAKVQITFIIMAYFTTKHNQTTRYMDGKNNPMKIYSKKLPLVRRQGELIQYFENALSDFYQIINMKPLSL